MTTIEWIYSEDKRIRTGAIIKHGNWLEVQFNTLEEVQQMLRALVFMPESRKEMSKEDKKWATDKLKDYPSLFGEANDE